jgi:hypothetical protein
VKNQQIDQVQTDLIRNIEYHPLLIIIIINQYLNLLPLLLIDFCLL